MQSAVSVMGLVSQCEESHDTPASVSSRLARRDDRGWQARLCFHRQRVHLPTLECLVVEYRKEGI
jgi:hypothetical protein